MVVLLTTAFGCAKVAWRNYLGLRRAASRPPLEKSEVLAAVRPASSVPTSWVRPAQIDEPALALAYRDYACERGESLAIAGEVLLLVAGAALGASVPALSSGDLGIAAAAAAILCGAAGAIAKRRSDQSGSTWQGSLRRATKRCSYRTRQTAVRRRSGSTASGRGGLLRGRLGQRRPASYTPFPGVPAGGWPRPRGRAPLHHVDGTE